MLGKRVVAGWLTVRCAALWACEHRLQLVLRGAAVDSPGFPGAPAGTP